VFRERGERERERERKGGREEKKKKKGKEKEKEKKAGLLLPESRKNWSERGALEKIKKKKKGRRPRGFFFLCHFKTTKKTA
jgi:hypothetical protein